MSRRNRPQIKTERRALRELRKSPPGYIDLVHEIKMRARVTTGDAKRIILAGHIKSGSHVIGRKQIKNKDGRVIRTLLDQDVPAELRNELRVA